eukprot:13809868-Alexandrium_andersonii.AAC.1
MHHLALSVQTQTARTALTVLSYYYNVPVLGIAGNRNKTKMRRGSGGSKDCAHGAIIRSSIVGQRAAGGSI